MQDPGLSSDDDEEDVTPTTSAFDVLMGPPPKKAKVDGVVDPIVIAVVYIRWLRWIDPSAPLYGCPYVGQAVRVLLTANEVAVARWQEENRDAMREDKRVGLLHELRVHGPEAFDNQIVEWKHGPRSEVQAWADERETALIAEHGGPLRDESVRCKQTLNLDHGGKFGMNFESRDALRTVAWLHFQDEMEAYVDCYEKSLVPRSYVSPSSGYKLGQRLAHVRQGELWRGHPDEAKRVEWLESLLGWAWNAMETDEWRDALSERAKTQWANADEETRADWSRKKSEAQNRPEVKAKHSKSAKAQAKREREADPEYRSRRAKTQMTQPEALERQSKNAVKWWETATREQIDAMESNRKKTVAASRETRMKDMTELQRKSEIAKQESNQRKSARQKRQLLALRQVPGWEGAKQSDIPKARRVGVLPSID